MFHHGTIKNSATCLAVVISLVIGGCGGSVTPTKVAQQIATTPSPKAEPTKVQPTTQVTVTPTAISQPTQALTKPATAVPTENPPQSPPQTYKVGDTVEVGNLVVVVLGWDTPAGEQFKKPTAGRKFTVLDLVLLNKGASAISFSTMLQLAPKDDTAQRYDVDFPAMTAAAGASPDGSILSGERVRGQVGYQVPDNAKGLTLGIDAK